MGYDRVWRAAQKAKPDLSGAVSWRQIPPEGGGSVNMLTTDGFRLDGRVALITGSGRNIGRAVAECYAAAGAKVVINGHRDKAALDETAAAIRANGGEVLPIMADVSDHHAVRGMIDETVATLGGIDIVVSNVGVRKYRAFLDTSPEEMADGDPQMAECHWRSTLSWGVSRHGRCRRSALRCLVLSVRRANEKALQSRRQISQGAAQRVVEAEARRCAESCRRS